MLLEQSLIIQRLLCQYISLCINIACGQRRMSKYRAW